MELLGQAAICLQHERRGEPSFSKTAIIVSYVPQKQPGRTSLAIVREDGEWQGAQHCVNAKKNEETERCHGCTRIWSPESSCPVAGGSE